MTKINNFKKQLAKLKIIIIIVDIKALGIVIISGTVIQFLCKICSSN